MTFRYAKILQNNSFPNSYSNRVDINSLSISHLLLNPFIKKSIENRDSRIVNFITDNIRELIRISIFSDDNVLSNKANNIISIGNYAIISSISNCNYLQDLFHNLLEHHNSKNISNLATILQQCITLFPESINSTLGFFGEMISFSSEYSVVYMFEVLLSNSGLIPLFYFLKRNDFVNNIIKEMVQSDNDELRFGLIQVYYFSCKNEVLKADCISSTSLNFLATFQSESTIINQYYWKILSEIISIDNIQIIHTVIDLAFIELSRISATINQYHVETINFLSRVLLIDSSVFKPSYIQSIIDTFLIIYRDHSHHSFALSAVNELMVKIIHEFPTNTSILNPIVIFFSSLNSLGDNITRRAYLVSFINIVINELQINIGSSQPIFKGNIDHLDSQSCLHLKLCELKCQLGIIDTDTISSPISNEVFETNLLTIP